MTDDFLVMTPEKVVIGFRVSGLATRAGAHIVDVLLASTLSVVPVYLASLMTPILGEMAVVTLGSLASSLVFLGYFVLFEWLGQGATPGKRATRIRVVLHDGTPITFSAALYRNLMRPADFLPLFYLVGFLAIFTNPRSQRLGDLVAGTVVVVERVPGISFHPAPHHVGIHRFESTVGELKKMSLDEYYALKKICDRSPLLPPETVEWSVQEVWVPFAKKHGITPVPGVHPIYQMEAVVMKFGRLHKLI